MRPLAVPVLKTMFSDKYVLVKKSKRGACRQNAATVLPDRTAATSYIYSSLSSFEFDIVGNGAPHDGKVPSSAAPM